MSRSGYILASLLFFGGSCEAVAQSVRSPPVRGVAAETVKPAEPSALLETPVVGGVHIIPSPNVHSDSAVISELAESGDAEKQNLAAVMKFVDAEGGIYGAEKACMPARAILFQKCAFLILDNWKHVYGSDLPHTQLGDGHRTEDIIVATWTKVSDRSEAISRDAQSRCGEVDSAMMQSKIWHYCTQPDWSQVPDGPVPASTLTGSDLPQSPDEMERVRR